MHEFQGKTAVITGAASGIGLASARILAQQGMQVALIDNREDAVHEAAAHLRADGMKVIALTVDIQDATAVETGTEKVLSEFGTVHLLMNNAAVFLRGHDIAEPGDDVWDWLLNVNLYGTLHCIRSFLPHMLSHGEDGHIVNTCSISGFVVRDRKNGLYATSKFALAGLSEALAFDLAGTSIGVSVLLPGVVASDFYLSSAQHRGDLGGPNLFPTTPEDNANGMLPDEVARRMLDGIRNKRFYIATHPATRPMLEQKYQDLMAAYDAAESYRDSVD